MKLTLSFILICFCLSTKCFSQEKTNPNSKKNKVANKLSTENYLSIKNTSNNSSKIIKNVSSFELNKKNNDSIKSNNRLYYLKKSKSINIKKSKSSDGINIRLKTLKNKSKN